MTERRSSSRIPVNIDASFFLGNMFYSGKVLNLSCNGMLIKTNMNISKRGSFIVFIPANKELPKLTVRVRRITGNNGISPNIGVELIDPPRQYTDFVNDQSYYQYL